MSRLYDALRRAEAERERIRGGGPAQATQPPPAASQPTRRPRLRLPEVLPFPPLARGVLIFASGAVLALAAARVAPRLHPAAQPVAQPALAASPAGLKLDYRLDLTRKGDAAR